jgi:hypothetical protein
MFRGEHRSWATPVGFVTSGGRPKAAYALAIQNTPSAIDVSAMTMAAA